MPSADGRATGIAITAGFRGPNDPPILHSSFERERSVDLQTFSLRREQDAHTIADVSGDTTLIILFGDPEIATAAPLIAALRGRFPAAILIGCSSAGEIVGDSILDHTVSGDLIGFAGTTLRATSASVDTPEASFAAGTAVAQALAAPDLRGILVLSDGLHVNGSELVRGINAVLPPEVPVTGGLAGDGDRFQQTWGISDGHPVSGVVSAVGFYGDAIRLGHGSKGGWDIFGQERVVTRSAGNVLFELDGRPALALYKQYLGELAAGLPSTALLFPLAVRIDDDPDKQIVRTILGIDEAAQSLTFAGDVPQGSRAQLMRADFDRLIGSAGDAAVLACPGGAASVLSVAISCVGRRLILGERCEEELEAALEFLSSGTQQIGFYSYGEIAPFAAGQCDFHSQTLTLTTITELAA